jgi:predicted neuraminidase
MKLESPFVFYPRYGWETVRKLWGYWRVYRQFKAMLDEALNAPDRWTYADLAITPPKEDEFEQLSLYHETSGGEAALARKRRDDAIREHVQAHDHAHDHDHPHPHAREAPVAAPRAVAAAK